MASPEQHLMKCHKLLHTSVMLSLAAINKTTKIGENKIGIWKEICLFNKKPWGKKRRETFGFSGLIFSLIFQLKQIGK